MRKNVESVYPLSPMQQGMLFHTLYQPESGMYFEQFSCTLQGALDETSFRAACQHIVKRHPVLRTAFVWEGQSQQLQVVFKRVELPWQSLDWRTFNPQEQTAKLSAFMQADRQQGFDLKQPPIMRLTLIHLADDAHRFIWSHHHMLLDGWSLPIVLKELLTCYEMLRRNEPVDLPPSRPFKNYITWLQNQDLGAAEDFWRQSLQGFDNPTPLVERIGMRAPEHIPAFQEARVALSAGDSAGLQSLARKNQLTINTLVQGAWALVLSRYTASRDVVFGVTVSGRPTELQDVASMVGLFINTLPLRVQAPPKAQLIPWLQTLQAHLSDVRQFEYSPLFQVQGWSQIPPGAQLFESLLVFENYPLETAFTDTRISLAVTDVHTSEWTNYPLTVIGYPRETLALGLSYDAYLFAPEIAGQMLQHLKTLLESFVSNPQAQLSQIAMLNEAERQRLLYEWNQSEASCPPGLIHELFTAQAEQTPEALAVVFEDQSLTYTKLNQQANQLAHYLQSLGIGPESLVGICVERSPQMITAILGVLKAGAAFVPLDPDYPQERLTFILQDAQIAVLLSQQRLSSTLPKHTAQLVCLDADWESISQQSAENPRSGVTADNLAYVIYTSGSTGKPKGALLTHRGLPNLLQAQRAAFGLQPDDHMLQFASLNFDAATFEIWMALGAGATLYLGTREQLLPGPTLSNFMRDKNISAITVTPSTLTSVQLADLPALKTITVAGEVCPPDLVARWAPGRRFFNLYGPTETTIWVTSAACQLDDPTPPIGRPLQNLRVYVVDQNLQPVPVGVPGELLVGGVGLARGYLDRPGLTASSFVPDPFGDQPGARLYRTGDLVRYRPDGALEFLGRIDQQIKLRGFRIELGEIEAVLVKHPAIREAAVALRGNRPDEQRLAAYYVSATKPPPSLRKLRRFLRDWLPDHMTPTTFMVLESLPLNPSGKLDRRALPKLGSERPDLGRAYVAPRNDTERNIAAIWQQVLQVDKVGIHDNFFELGGHSLSMVQVHDKLCETLKRDLTIAELFKYPTVESLAGYLSQDQAPGQSLEKAQERAHKQKQALLRQRQQRRG